MNRAKGRHRFDRDNAPSLRNWDQPHGPNLEKLQENASVQCGWGRLIFAHTFPSVQTLAETLCDEKEGERDIALYLRDPHVVLSLAPQELFLDPSHTYRLWFSNYRADRPPPKGLLIRRVRGSADVRAMNRLYASRSMVPVSVDFVVRNRNARVLTHFVVEDPSSGEIVGTVTGVDHVQAFSDPEQGSSLWCLAVDPQAPMPGIGQALVRHLAEHYQARGRAYMDLSVMHDNTEAIALYEKLGFQRVPVFCLKRKNPINEPLFIGPQPEASLNPYAGIIVKEARRRGIGVEIIDAELGYFSLTSGGRTIRCRESLSDLTTAVAMSLCDDKRACWRLLKAAEISVPSQRVAGTQKENERFLRTHRQVVVKPVQGEQGRGVAVDVRTPRDLGTAITRAQESCPQVLIEQFVSGEDIRVIVIGSEVVAAAVRRPAQVVGTGLHTVKQLIQKQSRRRAAATGNESRIPEDAETQRCVEDAGYAMTDILPAGEVLVVRKTANLHTGGTIHDVTDRLSSTLEHAAIKAARALDIPVVGFDFIADRPEADEYVIIEANERPGLANHEPQPTAEKFVDLLFPQTVAERGLSARFEPTQEAVR